MGKNKKEKKKKEGKEKGKDKAAKYVTLLLVPSLTAV